MTYGDSSNQITAGLHLKHTTKLNQTQDSALTHFNLSTRSQVKVSGLLE